MGGFGGWLGLWWLNLVGGLVGGVVEFGGWFHLGVVSFGGSRDQC